MAIQGTQVPMYTSTNVHKHTLFLYFSIFFLKNFYVKNKINQNWKENKQKHIKQEQNNA